MIRSVPMAITRATSWLFRDGGRMAMAWVKVWGNVVPGLLLIPRWRVHRCQPAVRCAPEALPPWRVPAAGAAAVGAGGTIHTPTIHTPKRWAIHG
jgi:hypothetical protein